MGRARPRAPVRPARQARACGHGGQQPQDPLAQHGQLTSIRLGLAHAPRRHLPRARTLRGLARQLRHLVVGRRDRRRLHPRLPRHGRRLSRAGPLAALRRHAGAQPRRRPHLEGGADPVPDARRTGPVRRRAHDRGPPRRRGPPRPGPAGRASRRHRLLPSRLRPHVRQDGAGCGHRLLLLHLRGPLRLVARPLPSAHVQPHRRRSAHGLHRRRRAHLHSLPDGHQGQRPRGARALRAHRRRRAQLSSARMDRTRTRGIRHHARRPAHLALPPAGGRALPRPRGCRSCRQLDRPLRFRRRRSYLGPDEPPRGEHGSGGQPPPPSTGCTTAACAWSTGTGTRPIRCTPG